MRSTTSEREIGRPDTTGGASFASIRGNGGSARGRSFSTAPIERTGARAPSRGFDDSGGMISSLELATRRLPHSEFHGLGAIRLANLPSSSNYGSGPPFIV